MARSWTAGRGRRRSPPPILDPWSSRGQRGATSGAGRGPAGAPRPRTPWWARSAGSCSAATSFPPDCAGSSASRKRPTPSPDDTARARAQPGVARSDPLDFPYRLGSRHIGRWIRRLLCRADAGADPAATERPDHARQRRQLPALHAVPPRGRGGHAGAAPRRHPPARRARAHAAADRRGDGARSAAPDGHDGRQEGGEHECRYDRLVVAHGSVSRVLPIRGSRNTRSGSSRWRTRSGCATT